MARKGVTKRFQEKNLDKISETQSIPEAGITGTVGTTYDSDGNPANFTNSDGRVLNSVTPARAATVARKGP